MGAPCTVPSGPGHRALRPRMTLRPGMTFRPGILGAGLAALALAAAGCGGSSGTGSSGSGGTGGSTATLNTLVIANAVKVDTLDPGAELGQRVHLAGPEPVQQAAAAQLHRHRAAAGPRHVMEHREERPDLYLPPADGCRVLQRQPGDREATSSSRSTGRGTHPAAGASCSPRSRRSPRTNAHTVVIKLSQTHAPLLADLAMYAYSIVPENLVKSQGKAFFQHPVGSGPFMVTSYKPGQRGRPGRATRISTGRSRRSARSRS